MGKWKINFLNTLHFYPKLNKTKPLMHMQVQFISFRISKLKVKLLIASMVLYFAQ